jgi:hypothetical protein
LLQEDFRQVIDSAKLQRYVFSADVRIMKIERPLAVQIVMAQNVGVPKKGGGNEEEGEEEGSVGGVEEEKRFESTYLDRNLVKEKKKANKEAARIMKLMLTDGLNEMEAIEFERFKNMEYFNIGQKLML